MLWITLRWTGIQGGVGIEILIVASCYRNCDELWPHGALGLYADYFALLHLNIGLTLTSRVIEIKSCFEHLFSIFSFCVLYPPSCKWEAW